MKHMKHMKEIKLGSRASKLAVVQTEMVMNHIKQTHPQLDVSIVTMETTGDKRLDVTLDKIGGKGLFVKELDQALMDGRIDLSVNCLKDMPMEESDLIPIVAYTKREDPRDVLVLPAGKTDFDGKGVIGCSSFRRRIQAKKLFPNADFQPVRGNIHTRLCKLDQGQYDALILAAAGLKRAGLEDRISRYFEAEEILPAAGQGILAVQGRKGEDYCYLDGIGNFEDTACALAERTYIRLLNGGCSSPVAAYATIENHVMKVRGLYYKEETGEYFIDSVTGKPEEAKYLARVLVQMQKTFHPGR
ncbi:MAG: hydroxymethylbilane synthase [Dorea sp.]|nr:hydroxymethylbilane synthase [Dorea sp.]